MGKEVLQIEKLKESFLNKENFKIADLQAFYHSIDKDLPKTTINWRINSLVKSNAIQRIGRGMYKCGSGNHFTPELSQKASRINNLMKINFPYLKFLIWQISEINILSQHLINKDIIYVEVEREAVEAVFELLREKLKYVLKGKSNEDVYLEERIIVVRSLVSGSPSQLVKNVPTTSIEKLLVDLYCDKEFEFLQGYELTFIFNTAFSKYTINTNKLLRYASRKARREQVAEFLLEEVGVSC